MTHARRFVFALLSAAFAAAAAEAAPNDIATSGPGPIPCSNTPFGQRLTLGLEQEYAVVRGNSGSASALIGIHDGAALSIGVLVFVVVCSFVFLSSVVALFVVL